MKFTFKIAVEIRRSRPEPCDRQHADEAPAELASLTEAVTERAPAWDFESSRSPAVAARFGFAAPAPAPAPAPARGDHP